MRYKIVYGEDFISIHKKSNPKKDIVYWNKDEWLENPELIFSIAHAVELAYLDRLEEYLQ